jgi:hypothetical protein
MMSLYRKITQYATGMPDCILYLFERQDERWMIVMKKKDVQFASVRGADSCAPAHGSAGGVSTDQLFDSEWEHRNFRNRYC